METKKKIDFFFFQESSKLNSTCILTCAEELKSFKKVSTCTYMSTSGMHRRPFEGRHLVSISPLLSHNFLPSQVDTLVPMLFTGYTNSMPAKFIATLIFLHKNMLIRVFLLSCFVIYFIFFFLIFFLFYFFYTLHINRCASSCYL